MAAVFFGKCYSISGTVEDIEDTNADIFRQHTVVDEIIRVIRDRDHADAFERPTKRIVLGAHKWLLSKQLVHSSDRKLNSLCSNHIVPGDGG